MNEKQIKLVQSSFTKVAPQAVSCSVVFYRKLFELDPEIKSLFSNDIHVQGIMLMKVLSMAVNSLYDLESIQKDLRELGQRHKKYGVEDKHYLMVETALLAMLRDVLAESFSTELEGAWKSVFRLISLIMKGEKNISKVEVEA